MNLLIPTIGASRRRNAWDADAADWFSRVAAAGSSITDANKAAVNAFVVGCKADGIWASIKASCLLCATNDLTGALVPLVGAAPTNNGFVTGDYSRTLGLTGDGTTKWLDTNRDQTADPTDNCHMAAYVTAAATTANGRYISGSSGSHGAVNGVAPSDDNPRFRNRTTTISTLTASFSPGLIGTSRNNSANYVARAWGAQSTFAVASTASVSANISVFSSSGGSGRLNTRLSFYTIGEAIDLGLLATRLATLMSALS